MNWRGHVFTSFAIAGLILFYYELLPLTDSIIFLTLLVFGALTPDLDLKAAKIHRSLFAPIALIIKYLIYIPLSVLLLRKVKHRGIMHTPLLGLLSSLVVAFYGFMIGYALGDPLYWAYIPSLGFLCGFVLHLLEDFIWDHI